MLVQTVIKIQTQTYTPALHLVKSTDLFNKNVILIWFFNLVITSGPKRLTDPLPKKEKKKKKKKKKIQISNTSESMETMT